MPAPPPAARPGHHAAPEFPDDRLAWVLDDTDLAHLLVAIEGASEAVLDLETTGLDEYAWANGPRNGGVAARVVLLALTLPSEGDSAEPDTWLVPLSHPDSPFLGTWRATLGRVALELERCGTPVVGQNIKFDCRWITATTGVDLSGLIAWDTRISSHLLDETTSTSLKPRAAATFGIDRWDDFSLKEPGAAERVPLFQLGAYGARDTYWTWRLAEAHRARLMVDGGGQHPETVEEYEDARLGKLAVWCAMPTVASLTAIEQRGIMLDSGWTEGVLSENLATVAELTAALAARYDMPQDSVSFAPTSHWFQEWSQRAVDAGDLRVIETTPLGKPGWSKSALVRLERSGSHVAASLLELRRATKRAEYLSSWLALVDPDGAIRTSYGVVSTGRLSASDPNVQQITKELRPAFVARPRTVLIDLDYSQIEMRIAAHVSGCEPMIEAFQRGDDLHNLLGSRITGKAPADVLTMERQAAKCFHPDTEVLTPGGWKRLGDLREGEEVMQGLPASDGSMALEWATPYQVYTQPNEHDHLVHLRNEGMDLIVTPDHAMLGQRANGAWVEVLPEEMPKVRRWPNAGQYAGGGGAGPPDDVLRLAVAIQADGSYAGRKVRFGFTKARKIERMRALLGRLGIDGQERTTTQGAQEFRFNADAARSLLNEDKTLPWAWLDLPWASREVVLEEARWWDGTKADNWRAYQYLSQTQHNIEVMQALAALTGRKTRDDGTGRLTIRANGHSRGGNLSVTRIPYTGDVACLAVPSGIVVVRYRGVVCVTKQSANFGLLYGMGPTGLRSYAEDSYGVSFSQDDAEVWHAAFFDTWVGMSEWHARVARQVLRTGQVASPIGRVRRLPATMGEERAVRAGINAPVQGMASDLMQIAAASIGGFLPGVLAVPGASIVATVHDSIVVEAPESDWRAVAHECALRMTEGVLPPLSALGCTLSVPLVVEAVAGKRWGHADERL